MIRATWILGSLTAFTLAACGPGERQHDTTGGVGAETGTGTAPGAATMDTALTGTGVGTDTVGMGMDTGRMGTGTTRADTAR